MDLIKHGGRQEGGEGKGGKVSLYQAEFPLQQPLLLSLAELLERCNPTHPTGAWAASTAAPPAHGAAHRGWRNRVFNHFDLPMFLLALFSWFPWQPARCAVTAMLLQPQPRPRCSRTRPALTSSPGSHPTETLLQLHSVTHCWLLLKFLILATIPAAPSQGEGKLPLLFSLHSFLRNILTFTGTKYFCRASALRIHFNPHVSITFAFLWQ